MKSLKILDWPSKKYYSETHPFHRWKKQFRDKDIKVQFYYNHLDNDLNGADYLIIHSRYFENGWQNIHTRNEANEEELKTFLLKMKKSSGKLIWFDAADSTGSSDFAIISLVDVFLKKQILKNKNYYTNTNDLRIWLNYATKDGGLLFETCPQEELHKVKIGWNIGFNDYRVFGYKMTRLSNYLSYNIYKPNFTNINSFRNFDLSFRGTVNREGNSANKVAKQRNDVLNLLSMSKLNVIKGPVLPKSKYLKELRNTKISISPYGWGEICYRDFESFITGSLLIKPTMEHLDTFPNLYLPNETYIPVSWNLNDLSVTLETVIKHHSVYKDIALNAQEMYKNAIYDSETFVENILSAIN